PTSVGTYRLATGHSVSRKTTTNALRSLNVSRPRGRRWMSGRVKVGRVAPGAGGAVGSAPGAANPTAANRSGNARYTTDLLGAWEPRLALGARQGIRLRAGMPSPTRRPGAGFSSTPPQPLP